MFVVQDLASDTQAMRLAQQLVSTLAAATQTAASIALSTLGTGAGGGDLLEALLGPNNAFGTGGGLGGGGEGGGLGDFLGSIFGNLLGGVFADGGNPPLGVPSIAGERGLELLVPKTAETIVPNEALGGGGGPITIVDQTTGRIDSVEERRTPGGERRLIIRQAVEQAAAQFNDPNSRMSKTFKANYRDADRSRWTSAARAATETSIHAAQHAALATCAPGCQSKILSFQLCVAS